MKFIAAILFALIIPGVITHAAAAEKLQHVVCFKFKPTASPEEIKKVETAFADLKNKIPEIVALEWGTNVSKEKRDKGFTHCFIVTFKNEADRDTYIDHPAHKEFVKVVGPVVDDVFVIDFFAKK